MGPKSDHFLTINPEETTSDLSSENQLFSEPLKTTENRHFSCFSVFLVLKPWANQQGHDGFVIRGLVNG